MAGDGLGGERKIIELFEVTQYFLFVNNPYSSTYRKDGSHNRTL